MKRPRVLVASSVAIFAASLVTPVTAVAAEGPDPVAEGVCRGGWKQNVYGYKATHHGKGPKFKDGPGGTIVVTKTTSATVSTTVSGTGGVTVGFAVVEAKAEASGEATASVTWGSSHRYQRDIARNKYGHVQYGSWGHTATWEKYYQLPNCKKTQRKTGPVKIVNKETGYRYWETSR